MKNKELFEKFGKTIQIYGHKPRSKKLSELTLDDEGYIHTTKRYSNIIFIMNLYKNRILNKLSFNKKEELLILHTTFNKENIFIKYPGKESLSDNKDRIRPWDFRPKLADTEGNYIKDLSFGDIWSILLDLIIDNYENVKKLNTLLFKLAYMANHKIISNNFKIINFDGIEEYYNSKNDLYLFTPQSEDEKNFLKYNKIIIENKTISLEGIIYYMDLLAWNEDCKYYYRENYCKNNKSEKWMNNTGRINTFLTHLNVVYILNKIISNIRDSVDKKLLKKIFSNFCLICDDLQRQRGVAPFLIKHIENISYIQLEKKDVGKLYKNNKS